MLDLGHKNTRLLAGFRRLGARGYTQAELLVFDVAIKESHPQHRSRDLRKADLLAICEELGPMTGKFTENRSS